MKKISYFIIIVSIFLQPIFSQPYDPGVTEGELSVSLTGAANYTVPIKVIPGINGVQPNISLVYNSQGGNGVAGYGWNISSLSAITRIPATKFHDGFIDGVDLDSYDRYALDGQRLILKSGTYGGDGAVYETENYSNIKIVSYEVHPDGAQYGPAYFKVFYPDGSIATYGQGGSSYGARNKMSWALAIKQTASGLYINYTYINTYNTQLISYIGYGTKLGQAAPYEIRFNYVNRHRRETAYIGGQQIYNPYILNHITVKKRNGASFRNYELEYSDTHLGYQRLVKITEKNGDNSKSLNPIIFEYDDYNGNFSFTHTSSSLGLNNINGKNTGYISGDFNGDARMDMILYPKTGTDARKKLWVKLSDTYNGVGF